MRKNFYLATLVLLYSIISQFADAQDYLGISTGNYAGITGVMLQPASIVDSRYKFDVNLFSTSVNFSNNYLLVNRDALLKFNKDNFGDYPTFKEKYLTQAALGANEKAYFNISNRTQIPLSFMATTGKKSAIALNIQSRSMIQGRDITQDLASAAFNNFVPATNTGSIDASGFNLLSLNWVEVGLTYGRVLCSNEKNFLKVAFTGKYLGGVSSLALGSNDFRLGINRDSTFNFNTSNTQYSHNQNADFNNVFDRNFSPDANSFGFDAGLVYEYRGNIDKFKYFSRDDEKSYEKERRDVNKYMFKVGVSLLDAGKFNFNKPTNVNNFSGNISNWDIKHQNYNNLAQFDTALARRTVALPNNPRSYSVYLPTAMSIQLDIRFVKGFYLNLLSYNSVKTNSEDYHFNNYDYYTITPRWESRNIGIYIPYTFGNHQQLDAYKDNLLGATVRLGPVFIGSSNLGTMAFNKNLKAADVHVGLKIGFTYGKPNKASMFLEKITFKKQLEYTNDTVATATNGTNKTKKDTINKNITATKPSPLIVDYKNGQIYSDGNQTGNIIIVNNNYYYGNTTVSNKDSVMLNNYKYDSANKLNDSISRITYKYDSTQKILNDSLNRKKTRLDSLIKNMQQLRKRMDSSSMQYHTDTITTQPKKTSFIKTKDSTNTVINSTDKTNAITQLKKDSTAKTKNVATTKTIIEKDNVYTNSNDPSQLKNQQKQYLPNQREGIVFNNPNDPNVQTAQQYREQQDHNFDRYINESNNLQREINDLQNEIARQRRNTNTTYTNRYPNNNPNYTNVYPVYAPTNNNKPTVVYIRDTIYIEDTTRLYDTTTLTKNMYKTDTLIKAIPSAAKTIVVTEKQKIDYSDLPSDFVLFPTGKSSIQAIYNKRLNYISNILIKEPQLFGLITGHTDATGSLKMNEALSLKRAETVKNYLIDKGVKSAQLIVSAKTANDNDNTENADNRRTDVKITDKK